MLLSTLYELYIQSPLSYKIKIFDACILTVARYGMECVIWTKQLQQTNDRNIPESHHEIYDQS